MVLVLIFFILFVCIFFYCNFVIMMWSVINFVLVLVWICVIFLSMFNYDLVCCNCMSVVVVMDLWMGYLVVSWNFNCMVV